MKRTKKLLSALLLIAMLSSAMPVLADNADSAVTESAAASQGFTVRYELNYYLAPKIAARKIAPGEIAPKVNGYTRDGWIFAGWSLEKRGPLYDFSTPVTTDMTLYAQWIQLRRNNMDAIKAVQEAETAPETEAPETEVPETEAAETEVPETKAPETEAPETEKPAETEVEEQKHIVYDEGVYKCVISFMYRDGEDSWKQYDRVYRVWNVDENDDLSVVIPDFPGTNITLVSKYQNEQDEYVTIKKTSVRLNDKKEMEEYEYDQDLYSYPSMNGIAGSSGRINFHSLADGENHFNVRLLLGEINGVKKYANMKLTVIRKTENEWENPYTDITEDHPYYNEIKFCAQNGYMGGVTATEFDADSEITNAMLAATLYRVAGSPDVDSDKSKWYSDAMAWMKENKIFRDDNADPNAKVTRLELAYAMLGYTKIVYPNYKPFIISAIAMDLLNDEYEHTCGMATWIDEDRIHPERTCARCAMGIASQTGMLPLYDGNFIPGQLATRANLASSIAGLKQQLFEILKDNPDGFKDPETAQSYWS